MKQLMNFVLPVVLFLTTPLTARADVSVEPETEGSVWLWVTGTISEADASQFERLSPVLEHKTPSIKLNSRGGDVKAAMKIGRIIRKYDGETIINGNNKCYSSCALIFISGVQRIIIDRGELGLHRPYFASAPQSREAIEKQVPLMLSMIKSYISEMGVTDNFYQLMVNTDPSAITTYTGWTIEKLVPSSDPTYDEILAASLAGMYGITTAEYRRRSGEATSTCFNAKGDPAKQKTIYCHEAMMWGLSESVYRDREAKWVKSCRVSPTQAFSAEQQAILDKTPIKQRNTLPFVEQLNECKRNIMLGR